MQPVNHGDIGHIIAVGYVQVVFQFGDDIAFDLSELGLLAVEEHTFLIGEIKERIVSGDNGLGLAWKMCPKVLVVGAEDCLIDCPLYDEALHDGGNG